jgi:hypothetical protein
VRKGNLLLVNEARHCLEEASVSKRQNLLDDRVLGLTTMKRWISVAGVLSTNHFKGPCYRTDVSKQLPLV